MSLPYLAQPWFTPYAPLGMGLTYATTTTLTIGSGITPNSTYENLIEIPADVSVNIALTGAGGLDTGTLAASTHYNIFVIASTTYPYSNEGFGVLDNPYPPCGIFSASTTPSLPFNYDMYRYVGSFYTTAGSLIVPFLQSGTGSQRTMMYQTAVSEQAAGTSATYANIDVASSVPKAGLQAILKVEVTPTAAGNAAHILPYGVTATNGFVTVSGDVAAVVNTATGQLCATGSNSGVATLQYKVTGAVTISVQGYIDQL